MRSIYLLHSDATSSYISSEITALFTQIKTYDNFFTISEDEFDRYVFNDEDVVVVYNSARESSKDKLRALNCKKVLYTIDESKRVGSLFEKQECFMLDTGIKTVAIVYPSTRNVEHLQSRGFNVIKTALHAMSRTRQQKSVDVLITGQLDADYYPTRTRLASAIMQNKAFCSRFNVAFLPHPGFDKTKSRHQVFGEKYFELLDASKIGLVCKCAWRDRLLQKYSEFGMSWVLPVGDVPSYAPMMMKQSMLDVSLMNDAEALNVMTALLTDDQKFEERTRLFHDSAFKHYESSTCVNKLYVELMKC